MKVSTFWSITAAQNVALKIASFSLSLALLASAVVNISLLERNPLIIDRGCDSSAVDSSKKPHTEAEIKAFLNKAVSERFNVNVAFPEEYISQSELKKRAKEQKRLKKQKIIQKVLIDEINFEEKLISADRLIRIGDVRSAFPLKFHFALEETKRSEENPYGLILSNVFEAKK